MICSKRTRVNKCGGRNKCVRHVNDVHNILMQHMAVAFAYKVLQNAAEYLSDVVNNFRYACIWSSNGISEKASKVNLSGGN